MIELKLTLRYEDTTLSAKAIGLTPIIVLDQMDDIIKELKNLDLQNFWARMTEHASKPVLTSAFNLEHKELITKLTDQKEAENDALEAKVHIYNIVNKSGKQQICKYCGGIISWDLRPERYLPLHCNELGQIVGDGACHG